MKKNNGQNGITLIALVVTIVVLLILAGITITYVLSDGGIFSTANKAGEKTTLAAVKEYADPIVVALYTDQYLAADEKTVNQEFINSCFPSGWTTTLSTTNCTFDATTKKAVVNGTVTSPNGTVYTVATDSNGVLTVTAPAGTGE